MKVSSMLNFSGPIGSMAIFVAALTMAGTTAPVFAGSDNKGELVVGRASMDPKDSLVKLQPFAEYLAKRLKSQGIMAGKALIVPNKRGMSRALRAGRVDLFSETPFSAIELIDEGVAELLALEWKRGVASYYSVFVSRKNQKLSGLADLRGKIIAFEDADSTSAFLLPLAAIRMSGLEAVELFSIQDVPPPDKVGYLFANGEVNIAAWVSMGVADAGAFSNIDWEDWKRVPKSLRDNLDVFHETSPVARSLLLVRAGMPKALKQALYKTLFAMPNDAEGVSVLNKYNKVKKFDPITESVLRDLQATRTLMEHIRENLRD